MQSREAGKASEEEESAEADIEIKVEITEEENRNSENKPSNKITEMNKKVTNIKNELSKSELFNKTLNKTEAPSKPKPPSAASSRSSLSSVISESDECTQDFEHRS